MANIAKDITNGNLDGLDLKIFEPDDSFGTKKAEADWLIKVGITQALSDSKLLEHLVVPGAVRADTSVIFKIFLEQVVTSSHLIIIENYIFNSNDAVNYPVFFVNCIRKFIPALDQITFIYTDDNRYINNPIKVQFDALIKAIKSTIIIEYKQTNLFHDRFILGGPHGKGLIVGASFNALGNKYSVIDYLQPPDNEDLYIELGNHGLI